MNNFKPIAVSAFSPHLASVEITCLLNFPLQTPHHISESYVGPQPQLIASLLLLQNGSVILLKCIVMGIYRSLISNEEFLVSASHQLMLISSLPFVYIYTHRRSDGLSDPVNNSD